MTAVPASPARTLARLRLQVAGGIDPGTVVGLPPRAAAAMAVAREVGAPLLPALDAIATAHEQDREIRDLVAAALAPARTVAIALLALPLVAVPALGRLLDVDLLAFYTTPLGMVVAGVAGVLWVVGAAMIVALVRRCGRQPSAGGPTMRVVLAGGAAWALLGPLAGLAAAAVARLLWRPAPPPPPDDLDVVCDLVATALSAGLPAGTALRAVAPHVPSLADRLHRLALQIELGRLAPGRPGAPTGLDPLAETLADGLVSGGAMAPALRTLARQLRSERGAALRAEAERLPTRLTFPTALCLLPATVLAIGAPIIGAGLGAVTGT